LVTEMEPDLLFAILDEIEEVYAGEEMMAVR
jgi:hypothetical protein